MKILFWVVAVYLILIFSVSFANSTMDRPIKTRYCDLVVAVASALIFLVLAKTFGGYMLR